MANYKNVYFPNTVGKKGIVSLYNIVLAGNRLNLNITKKQVFKLINSFLYQTS